MTNSVSTQIKPDIKRDAEKVFHQLGLTPDEAIAQFYRQVAQSQHLPFVPNGDDESAISSTRIMNYIKLYSSPDDEIMLQEEAVFRENQVHYQQLYPNEYIAIYQGEVVDHDLDEDELIERRLEKYGEKVVLIRHVDSDPDEVKVIRSHIIL
ncbi:MAG: type II toxin-antitoxin system RelB/DinJ family antitoxin [Chloroflexota bacterium]